MRLDEFSSKLGIDHVSVRSILLVAPLNRLIFCFNFIIDDRCIIIHGSGGYICWLITSMSTSTGHFLSLNKSHLNRPQTVFVYLGIEFDVPRQLIRIPSKRKEKIRARLKMLMDDLGKSKLPFYF